MNKTELRIFLARIAKELFNGNTDTKIELHHKIQMLLKILDPL